MIVESSPPLIVALLGAPVAVAVVGVGVVRATVRTGPQAQARNVERLGNGPPAGNSAAPASPG